MAYTPGIQVMTTGGGTLKLMRVSPTFGKSLVGTTEQGETIMARQKGLRCQFPDCVSAGRLFSKTHEFGRHLSVKHADMLDQQTFNLYQLRRLLTVARALKIQVGEGDARFVDGQTYSCGMAGCDYTVIYRNDQAIYKILVEHRNAAHGNIRIGRHEPGSDLSEMAKKKTYRLLAKKYQTRVGLGWFCTKCKTAPINQYPEGSCPPF